LERVQYGDDAMWGSLIYPGARKEAVLRGRTVLEGSGYQAAEFRA